MTQLAAVAGCYILFIFAAAMTAEQLKELKGRSDALRGHL